MILFELKLNFKFALINTLLVNSKIIIMDSGFGYIPPVTQLKKKVQIQLKLKKGTYWPKYTKAVDTVKFMAGKEVGNVEVWIHYPLPNQSISY